MLKLKQMLIDNIGIANFWRDYGWDGSNKNIKCPLSDRPASHPKGDKNPSFKIWPQTGDFKCFSSSCGIHGDIINFYGIINGLSNQEAIKELCRRYGIKQNPVQPLGTSRKNEIQLAHTLLLEDEIILTKLFNQRCITKSIIKKYFIGYYNKRLCTPIEIDGGGVNCNRHDIFGKLVKEGQAKSLWEKGASITPFPYKNISEKNILLCAGIPDTLCALSILEGSVFHPVTFGGERLLPKEYYHSFTEKNVFIAYDNDDAGRNGTIFVSNRLFGICSTIYTVGIPNGKKDLCDYFSSIPEVERKQKMSEMIKNAREIKEVTVEAKPKIIAKRIPYDSMDESGVFNKHLEVDITVVGVSHQPFVYPFKVGSQCASPKCPTSGMCKIFQATLNDGKCVQEVDAKDIIKFINISNRQKMELLRGISGCSSPKFKNNCVVWAEKENIAHEIIFTEKPGDTSTSKALRYGFVVDDTKIVPNTCYTIKCYPVLIPDGQKLTYIIAEAIPHESEINTFSLSDDMKHRLETLFNPSMNIEERVMDIQSNLEDTLVKMWGRGDVITAVNLAMFSPLEIIFNNTNNNTTRGWIDVCIIGDSGTAKSATVDSLMKHYKIGHTISGEHLTKAGIVGALQGVGTGRCLIWGAFPFNDGKFLFLDEVHGMSDPTILPSLSSMRSSGIAIKTVEGRTYETLARVRAVYCANAPTSIHREAYPITLMKEVFTEHEDRARFDLCLMLSNKEISVTKIHKLDVSSIKQKYTSDMMNSLVMWAWSRKPEQIIFDKEITGYILMRSMEMISKYGGSDIEIVHQSRYPHKLARLSASIALMTFSHIDCESVHIKREHVDFALKFQHRIYSKKYCKYDEYSNISKPLDATNIRNIEEIVEIIQKSDEINYLLEAEEIDEGVCLLSVGERRTLDGLELFKLLKVSGLIVPGRRKGLYNKSGDLNSIVLEIMECKR